MTGQKEVGRIELGEADFFPLGGRGWGSEAEGGKEGSLSWHCSVSGFLLFSSHKDKITPPPQGDIVLTGFALGSQGWEKPLKVSSPCHSTPRKSICNKLHSEH